MRKKPFRFIIPVILLFLFVFVFLETVNIREINVEFKKELKSNQKVKSDNFTDYQKFIEHNRKFVKKRSKKKFNEKFVQSGKDLRRGLTNKKSDNLKGTIIIKLNIGFLLEEINKRKLEVTVTNISRHKNYYEEEMIFKDPHVGEFSVSLLVPKGNSFYPAVIGLHGHGGNKRTFKNKLLGKELVKHGFVVIMPTFRAMDFDLVETEIAQQLYKNGFTLMGLRVYETLLLIKYLKWLNYVDQDRIGIMGHSGGSTVAYLASWVSSGIEAGVFDAGPCFLDLINIKMEEGGPWQKIYCETVPELAYYKKQIKNFKYKSFPHKRFEYGYPKKKDKMEVLQFFGNELKNESN